MAKTYVITSGKGGVGKTNIAVNSGVEFARRHLRTCLFDADLGLANVNILLGFDPERTLDELLSGDVPLEHVMVHTEHGLDVLPGSSGVEKLANLEKGELSTLLDRLQGLSDYDCLLIDTGSGISRNVISFCLAAEVTILVLTPENTSLADAYATLKVLSLNNYQGRVMAVVNNCISIPQAKKTYSQFQRVAEKHLDINLQPGGAVLQDPQLPRSISALHPAVTFAPDSSYAHCIRALVNNLLREQPLEENSSDSPPQDFWNRFVGVFESNLILPGEKKRPSQTENEGEGTDEKPESSEKIIQPNFNLGLWSKNTLFAPIPFYGYILEQERQGELTVEQLEKFISHDPVLLGRLLEIISKQPRVQFQNHQCPEIETLIQELGSNFVKELLHTTITHCLLTGCTTKEFLEINRFWLHSLRCALMAKSLAEATGYPEPFQAYLGGLLHDLGRLLLQNCCPELYRHCLPHEHPQEVLSEEKKRTGKTHAELGAELLQSWGINSFIADAARFHCESAEKIANTVNITRLICIAHQLSVPSAEQISAGIEQAREQLNLSPTRVFICIQTVSDEVKSIASLYGIAKQQEDQEIQEVLDSLRRKTVDHITLQGVLPTGTISDLPDNQVYNICNGLHLLFGLEQVVCLLPNTKGNRLRAVTPPQGYGSDFSENIVFSLCSKISQLVNAYYQTKISLLSEDDLETLADHQLLQVMGVEILLCIPLQTVGEPLGLLVCGIRETEKKHFLSLKNSLELFSGKAARNLKKSHNQSALPYE